MNLFKRTCAFNTARLIYPPQTWGLSYRVFSDSILTELTDDQRLAMIGLRVI